MNDAADSALHSPKTRGNTGILLAAFGAALIGGAIWWGFMQDEPYGSEPTPAEPVTQAPEPEVLAAPPVVPAQAEPTPEPIVVEEPAVVIAEPEANQPVITLAESDELLKDAIEPLQLGAMGQQYLIQPNSIERGVAIIDNLRQGEVPYKLLPVGRPSTKFSFVDDGLGVTIDPDSFGRYDGLATAVDRIDVPASVALYEQFKAPINTAWQMLGYGDTSFEQAALQALEQIMLAPDTDTEARLIKKEANWIYEDEALEALPAIQKQLMRMGPANANRIKDKARELRGALLDAQP